MTAQSNRLIYHSTVSFHSTLAIDLDVAARLHFDGVEVAGSKAKAFLDAGHSIDELKVLLADIPIPGVGYLPNVERQGSDRVGLLDEAESLFDLARHMKAEGVQVLTGPLDVRAVQAAATGQASSLYSGLLSYEDSDQVAMTAANLQVLADMAKNHGLILYLEALAWTPLNTVDKQLEVIRRVERDNVKMVIDFWHCYASGDSPDRIAKMAKDDIFGIHICDSLLHHGGIVDEAVLRDVATGHGVLKLRDWVDAVKATGYANWWSCELFSKRQRQENSYEVAQELLSMMRELVAGGNSKPN